MDFHPPGFRFYPTEEELVSFYLGNKLESQRSDINKAIPVLDIYDYNPWDLPEFAGELCRGDPEQWFFFIPRQEKEARGGRPNRLTNKGYWKATGSPSDVYSSQNRVIGRKRTMVFYLGRAPNGEKTVWKINEYKAIKVETSLATGSSSTQLREEFSLCRVYKTSKCFRSFDRRPQPQEMVKSDQSAAHHYTVEASASHQSQPVLPERPCSFDSSSSGGHNIANALESWDIGQNFDIPLIDNKSFWEWDEICCFDCRSL